MRRLGPFLMLLFPALAWPQGNSSVVNSPHNMSVSGPGSFKSQRIVDVCAFCHAPHDTMPEAPLWNREDSGQTYVQYGSSTLSAIPGQPAGSSRLCLACHDGTIALERLVNLPAGARANPSSTRMQGRSNLGTDLADDHPISFIYDIALQAANGQLAHPLSVPLPLEEGAVRCGTCHDPHDSTFAPFLRLPSDNGELCITCHVQSGNNWSWDTSAHATSTARPQGAKPWRERKPQWISQTVSGNSCFSCHAPHNAATPARLIVDREEATCFRCHDGGVADTDIQSELFKPSRHPVDVTPNFDHDAGSVEDPRRMRLHAECGDCHNAHAARPDSPMVTVLPGQAGGRFSAKRAPEANALIAGVSGLADSGLTTPEVDSQYEMCFKCHGVPGKSACENSRCTTARSIGLTRVDNVYNLRDKTDPDSNSRLVSYHPIVRNNPFNDSGVPSLRTELGLNTSSTLIYCTDCHNSDESSAGSGTGPEGPHGSIYPPILADRYSLSPISYGPPSVEAGLCFKCHDERVLRDTGTDSGYLHNSHEQFGTCITCHDPHGSTLYTRLVNFGTQNNLASAGSSPLITGVGPYSGPVWSSGQKKCWLQCHTGTEHLGRGYRPVPEDGGMVPPPIVEPNLGN